MAIGDHGAQTKTNFKGCGVPYCHGGLCLGQFPDSLQFRDIKEIRDQDTGRFTEIPVDKVKTKNKISAAVVAAKELGKWLGSHPPQSDKKFEAKNPAIYQKIKWSPSGGGKIALSKTDYATIIAEANYMLISGGLNPSNESDCDETLGAIRTNLIIKELAAAGYKLTVGKGRYGQPEITVFMLTYDAGRDLALEIGRQMNQESVIYGSEGNTFLENVIQGPVKQRFIAHKPREIKKAKNNFTSLPTEDGGVYKFTFDFKTEGDDNA